MRDDQVQEQDWVSDIQVRTLRTVADARSNDAELGEKVLRATRPPTRRVHFTFSLCAKRPKCQDDHVQTVRTVADARSNDPVRSQASSENESATAAQGLWRRTTRPQVSVPLFFLCLFTCSSQVARPPAHASIDGGIVPFNTGLWQHSSQVFSGLSGGSRQTSKSRHFVPTAW